MSGTNHLPFIEPTTDIRIVALNGDRTRKAKGSYTEYQVYFELSGAPSLTWRDIFGREWNDLSSTQGAGVDGRFLVMQCPLDEIATTHLPLLKKAVAATNEAYKRLAQEQAREDEHSKDEWMPGSRIFHRDGMHGAEEQRKAVDALAKSLYFE